MCVVSMIHDYHRERWPDPIEWDPTKWLGYQELLEKARKYDELMKQPDCPDPEKEKWAKELEEHMVQKYGLKPKKKAS